MTLREGNSAYFYDTLGHHPGLLKRHSRAGEGQGGGGVGGQGGEIGANNNSNIKSTSTTGKTNNSNNNNNNDNNNTDNAAAAALKMEENVTAMKFIFTDYGTGFLEACLLVSKRRERGSEREREFFCVRCTVLVVRMLLTIMISVYY